LFFHNATAKGMLPASPVVNLNGGRGHDFVFKRRQKAPLAGVE
jgi:hypothetical protein